MLHVTLCADHLEGAGHSALLTGRLCGATFFQTLTSRGVQQTSEPGVAAVVTGLFALSRPALAYVKGLAGAAGCT